jgi:hypothetical protein
MLLLVPVTVLLRVVLLHYSRLQVLLSKADPGGYQLLARVLYSEYCTRTFSYVQVYSVLTGTERGMCHHQADEAQGRLWIFRAILFCVKEKLVNLSRILTPLR